MKKIYNIIIAMIMMIFLLLLTGCGATKETVVPTENERIQNEYKNKNENETLSNIKIDDFILEDETLLTIVKNNNDFDVETLWIEAVFYDEENKVVGTVKDGFKILKANSETAITYFDTPSKFDTYKITTTLGDKNDYKSYADKIKIDSNNTGEKIVVTTENQSNKKIGILNIGVVYYKDNIPIGFSDETQYDIDEKKVSYFNILYAYDKNYKKVDFDEYKVFINSAYDQI